MLTNNTLSNLGIHCLGTLAITSLPHIRIAQTATIIGGAKIKAGDFYNQVTSESYGQAVELIAYLRYSQRAKFPERGAGTTPQCYSPDNVHGTQSKKSSGKIVR